MIDNICQLIAGLIWTVFMGGIGVYAFRMAQTEKLRFDYRWVYDVVIGIIAFIVASVPVWY